MPEFLKRVWNNYSKLGRNRKNKQVWRKPRGRHNKMREQRAGRPAIVKIGYRNDSLSRQEIVTVRNLADLEKVTKKNLVVVGNVGRKNKMVIVSSAKEKGITLKNVRVEKVNKEKPMEKIKNESK
ncbi:MAG: eL32 family ribosomal protein [Nanoarchaeota archaeon]|nr:eL32 family ribosomal protein [Nanoarchaeota archaeon]